MGRKQDIKYWTQFCVHLRQRGGQFRLPRPRKSHYVNFSIGIYKVRARQVIKPHEVISVTFIIERENSRTNYYDALKKQRVEIENELGEPLCWEETHGERRVSLIKGNTDPTNEPDWPRQHEWMATKLEKIIEVFRPIIES